MRRQRNTPGAGAGRNTRASAQLDAFPRSENQSARQSAHRKAVVSLRLSGAVINELDKAVKAANETRTRYNRITRSEIIQSALFAFLAVRKKGASK